MSSSNYSLFEFHSFYKDEIGLKRLVISSHYRHSKLILLYLVTPNIITDSRDNENRHYTTLVHQCIMPLYEYKLHETNSKQKHVLVYVKEIKHPYPCFIAVIKHGYEFGCV